MRSEMKEDRELMTVLEKVKRNRGIDFTRYRPTVLSSRLRARLHATGCESYWDYVLVLNRDPGEYDRLIESLTIKVSEFFRDSDVFELLRGRVIPEVTAAAAAGAGNKVHAWSCGAAFGQEAYSLAILFCEALGEHATPSRVDIIATDIDQQAVEQAPWGAYDAASMRRMKPHVLFKYFTRFEDRYVITDKPRSLVRFLHHNIVSDGAHPGMDLILCRNLLIYFEQELQQKVLNNLCASLNPGGFLVLGKVETLPVSMRADMEAVDPRQRVFRKPYVVPTAERGIRESEEAAVPMGGFAE